MILSICREEVDILNINYMINNIIKNGDVKQEHVPRWWESMADISVQMAISLIYYRFIVRFTIGLEFLFILFLLQFFLAQMSSYILHYIFIERYNIGIFESCYASMVCIESTAICCHGCCLQ